MPDNQAWKKLDDDVYKGDRAVLPEYRPYEPSKGRRRFQNVAIPLLALAEALSSRGKVKKSGRSGAIELGKALRQQDLDRQQGRRDEYKMALNRRLLDQRFETGQLGLETAQAQAAKRAGLEEAIKRQLGEEGGLTPESTEAIFKEYDPLGYAKQYMTGQQKLEQLQAKPVVDKDAERAAKAQFDFYKAKGASGEELSDEDLESLDPILKTGYDTGRASFLGSQKETKSKQAQKVLDEQRKAKQKLEGPVTVAVSDLLTENRRGIQNFDVLQEGLISGNIDIFDIDKGWTGMGSKYKNPEVAIAMDQLLEFVGRKASGAAISKSEWNNFQKQILDKKTLLTDQGKKAALKNLQSMMHQFSAGARLVNPFHWEKLLGESGLSSDPVIYPQWAPSSPKTDEDFAKLRPGSYYIDPDEPGKLYQK